MKKAILLMTVFLLSACADVWSRTNDRGEDYGMVESQCRAIARESARRQLPSRYDRDYGPAGFPYITRKDIENRETSRCLLDKGFTLSREWR